MKHSLLKFLNRENGPIVRLTTNSIGCNNDFFYSFATLSDKITKNFRESDILKFGGSGWSSDRLISQEKAITEAIERWAYKDCLDFRPQDAGIENDNTSNGFSALPKNFKIESAYLHSYCECIERYLLSCFADERVFELKTLNSNVEEVKLFDSEKGSLTSFKHSVALEKSDISHFCNYDVIYFVISLFWIKNAGVVVGSACNIDLEKANEKSLQECYMHFLASERLKSQQLNSHVSITDKRLKNYSQSSEKSLLIMDRLKNFRNSNLMVKIPKIKFFKEIVGDWNPEINVVRVLLEDTIALTEGDEWRFII